MVVCNVCTAVYYCRNRGGVAGRLALESKCHSRGSAHQHGIYIHADTINYPTTCLGIPLCDDTPSNIARTARPQMRYVDQLRRRGQYSLTASRYLINLQINNNLTYGATAADPLR
jgi:hypothetical protein